MKYWRLKTVRIIRGDVVFPHHYQVESGSADRFHITF